MSNSPRQHWSIGEVLNLLQDEFPEVTISKIRFLEGQGLIDPERTPSGYRRFYPEDFDRLRWVLIQQRDHYLPLRVIRERLDSGEVVFAEGEPFPDTGPQQRTLSFEGEPTETESDRAEVAHVDGVEHSEPQTESQAEVDRAEVDDVGADEAEVAEVEVADVGPASASRPAEHAISRTVASEVSLTRDELVAESGCSNALISGLERHGLIVGKRVGSAILYDGDALEIASIADRFAAHGLDPRHLRTFRLAAEREVGLFAQIVGPQFHRKAPEARQESLDNLHDLGNLAGSLRSILLGQMLRDQFPGA